MTKVVLGDLLRQLAEAIATCIGVPVTLTVDGECSLPSEVRVALYRRTEAVAMALQHNLSTGTP